MFYSQTHKENMLRILLSLCLSLSLCLNMGVPNLSDNQLNDPYSEIFWNIRNSLVDKVLLVSFIFLCLLWLNKLIDKKKKGKKKLFLLISIFISIIWLMSESFRRNNTLDILYSSYGQVTKSIIYFIGISYGMGQVTYYIYYEINNIIEAPGFYNISKNVFWIYFTEWYKKHAFFNSFVIIFILWLPHILISYPAYFCKDAYYQLAQYFGFAEFSSHHPAGSTLLMGGIIKIGSLISGNIGVFLYVLIQSIIFALILAYMFKLMNDLNTPGVLLVMTFAICIFVPYYTAYIGVFLKDNIYSYAILLFVIEMIYLFTLKEYYFHSLKHISLLALSMIGTILLRNNGKYIIYPTIFILLIYVVNYIYKNKIEYKNYKSTYIAVFVCFLLPIIFAKLISSFFDNNYVVQQGSIREALSLPMQQTARYVRLYEYEVTEDEKEAISNVLDYDNLANNYDPRIADPVKRTFKYEVTDEELRNYLMVWVKQFFKHPFVYIKATINQNYYLLYPYILNDTIYVNTIDSSIGGNHQEAVCDFLQLKDAEGLKSLKNRIQAFYKMCFSLPLLNLLSHPAFYTIMLIWVTIFSIYRKIYQVIAVSAPLWLSEFVVILSPVIQGHPRYTFPIIYSMPILIAYFIHLNKIQEETNSIDFK